MAKQLRKAVFPVAGLGTRFLPATKASPKEMLPVVDKPLIQYAVEEAAAAGVTEMIFITGRGKRSIEDHFDKAYELEAELGARGKTALLDIVKAVVPRGVNCVYIRQAEPLGLGHAVLCARSVVGDEPFAVLLADDLMRPGPASPPVLAQMVEQYGKHHASVLAVQEVARHETQAYGIVSSAPWGERTERVTGIVEKPRPEHAPSTLAVVGRYVLTPLVFEHLAALQPGAGGEIQLTDALAKLVCDEPVLAYRFLGQRYDCGSKMGYLRATVELALEHPEVGAEFAQFLSRHGTRPDGLASAPQAAPRSADALMPADQA